MKLYTTVLLISSIFVLFGCADDNDVDIEETSGIYIDYYNDWDVGPDDCCGQDYVDLMVSGKAPQNGSYLFPCVLESDTVIGWGVPSFVEEGEFDSVIVRVPDFAISTPGSEYVISTMMFASQEDTANPGSRLFRMDMPTISAGTDGECKKCCTDDNNADGRSRRYCYAQKRIEQLTGLKAEVTVQWGKLCCDSDPNSTCAAQSNAFLGIQDDFSTQLTVHAFAQAGYMRKRNDGDSFADDFFYIEVLAWDSTRSHAQIWHGDAGIPLPNDGDIYQFELSLNFPLGRWEFYVEDELILAYPVAGWSATMGNWASVQAEIEKRETDMVGTSSDPCMFDYLEYRTDGDVNYHDLTFGSSNVDCSRGAGPEWEIYVDADGEVIEIWDVNPLP